MKNARVLQIVLTVVGTAGIASVFLPFTYDTSPAQAILGTEFWNLALPFFLSFLVSAACLRWIVSGSLSRVERGIAYVVSIATAAVSLWVVIVIVVQSGNTGRDRLSGVIALGVIALGACFVLRNLRREPSGALTAIMALQFAYIANALLCLMGFYPVWQRGAYCTAGATTVFTLQIILFLARPSLEQRSAGTAAALQKS